jgi:hypothetical protein
MGGLHSQNQFPSSKRCRCGVPLQRTRSNLQPYRPASPLVRTYPRGLTSPSDVLIGERGRGLSWGSPPPASALVLTNPALAVLPRAAVLLHPFECHCHPSVGFRCPSGFHRKTAAVLRRLFGGTCSAPLMGFRSLQRSPAQRIRLFQGFPHPQPMRPQGSSPLDALIPFTPSRHFCQGRSWDCYLQGFSPPADPDRLSKVRTLLALPDLTLER